MYLKMVNTMAYQVKVLPSNFKRVEFLENTGTQYFLLNFAPTADLEISCDYMITSTATSNRVCGSRNNTSSNGFGLIVYASKYNFMYNREYESNISHLPVNTRHNYLQIKNNVYLDGSLEHSFPLTAFAGTKAFALFALNGEGLYIGTLRVYNFVATQNGVKICDLVPCYDIDTNTAGMYDFVSGYFYTNQGSGTFILGPDV